jgi:hypothetical protein
MWRSIGAMGVISGLTFLAACDTTTPGGDLRSDLERNRSLWSEQGMTSYVYGLERVCFCHEVARGPVKVTVQDGVVEGRAYVSSGTAVDPELEDLFPAVTGLFDLIEQAIEAAAFRIEVTYDPATGLPVDVSIDYDQQVIDEELGFSVVELPAGP